MFNDNPNLAGVFSDLQKKVREVQKLLCDGGIIHCFFERRVVSEKEQNVEEREMIAVAPLSSLTLVPALQEENEPGNSIVLAHLASALSSAGFIARNRKDVGQPDRLSTGSRTQNALSASLPS